MGSDVFLSAMVAKFDRFAFGAVCTRKLSVKFCSAGLFFLVTTLFGGKPAGVGCRFGLMAVRL